MNKLFVVSELFYPEETSTAFVMTKIVNKLAEKYSDIEVICGKPIYDKNQQKSDNYFINDNVKICRIKGIGGSKNNLVARSVRFITLSLIMFFSLLRKVKKNDKVVIVTNPAPIILLAALLKKLKGINLIILVHDVFPENTVPAGIFKDKNSLLYNFLCRIFNKAYSLSDKLIVVGRDMKTVMRRKTNENLDIKVIENWAENKTIIPQNGKHPENKIVFQFAGNLGRVQGLTQLLDIVRQCENNILEFHFVGEGAVKKDLIDFVTSNKLKNVIFQKGYKREEQSEILSNTDISVVTLSKGMLGLGVPSKTYNILAAGKPILYIGDAESEVDLLIRDYEVGFSFQSNEALLSFFNNLSFSDKELFKSMGEKARKLADGIYSEKDILEKYKNEI